MPVMKRQNHRGEFVAGGFGSSSTGSFLVRAKIRGSLETRGCAARDSGHPKLRGPDGAHLADELGHAVVARLG
jgi:hypothetical protein